MNANPYAFERTIHQRTPKLERELRSRRFQHAHVVLRVQSYYMQTARMDDLATMMQNRPWSALWQIKLDTYQPDTADQIHAHALSQYVSLVCIRFVSDWRYYERVFETYPNLRSLMIHFCAFRHLGKNDPESKHNVVVFPRSLQYLKISICGHLEDRDIPDEAAHFVANIPSTIPRRRILTSEIHQKIAYDRFNALSWVGRGFPMANGRFPNVTHLTSDIFTAPFMTTFPHLRHLTTRFQLAWTKTGAPAVPSLRIKGLPSEADCLWLLQHMPHVQKLQLPIHMTDRILQTAQTKHHLLELYTARPPGMTRLRRENHVLNHAVRRRAWMVASLLIAFVRAQPEHFFKDSILNLFPALFPGQKNEWTSAKSSAFMRTNLFQRLIREPCSSSSSSSSSSSKQNRPKKRKHLM